jgi:hypothetical protein
MNHCANQQSRRGLSQIEVVVSSLIVGVVLVGALNVLGGATRTNRVAAEQLDAPGLAHQLMGEILALPYEDPEEPGGNIGKESGESGGDRVDYDDVDDYHGWNMDPPQYKDGTPVPGAIGWERVVLVKYFDPSTGSTGLTDTGVKLITVQVDSPSGDQLQLNTLRSQWGSLQQAPAVDTTTVTSLDAQLQIGSTSDPVYASIHLKNHAHD